MRTMLRSRMSLLFVAVAALIAIPAAVALADDISNTLDGDIDATVETTSVNTGDDTSVTFKIQPRNGDGNNGCNIQGGESLVASVASNNTAVATVSPTQLTFGACSDTPSVTVTGVSAGTARISLSQVSNNTGGTFDFAPATFDVTVTDPEPPADTTAPTIDYTITGTLGNNDWYTSDVTLVWNVTDPESAVTETGCVDQNITSDQGPTDYSCSASSAGGDAGPVTATIKRDATTPTISGVASPAANGNGWNNTNVLVDFTCGDTLSGIASCGPDVTLSSDGADQSVTGTATDNAGNSDSATVGNIDIDKTPPTVIVTGVSNNATYNLGSVPAAGCSTTDSLSGKAQDATVNVTGGTTNGVGTFTATCSGGKDVAGNTNSASVQYKVLYVRDGGILQPINYDNTSVFSRGKAVPVKFKLAGDAPLGFNVSGWTLQKVSVSCTSFDAEDQVVEQVAENPSQSFRYDSSADQYIINADFKSAPVGSCWKARVTFNDGTTLESSIFRMQK